MLDSMLHHLDARQLDATQHLASPPNRMLHSILHHRHQSLDIHTRTHSSQRGQGLAREERTLLEQATPCSKHSQYFFRHREFLQRQPRT